MYGPRQRCTSLLHLDTTLCKKTRILRTSTYFKTRSVYFKTLNEVFFFFCGDINGGALTSYQVNRVYNYEGCGFNLITCF